MRLPRSQVLARRALVGLLSSLALAALPAAAQAEATWHDGVSSEKTYDTNCPSVILGNTTYEVATNQRVGFWSDSESPPKTGEVYYSHVVVFGRGNPCGKIDGHIEVNLPPHTRLAISAANPVICTAYYPDESIHPDTTDCPQSAGQGIYTNPSSGWLSFNNTHTDGGAWPLPRGYGWEIRFPVVSDERLVGTAHPCDCLVGAIWAVGADVQPWDGPPEGWNFNGVPSSGPFVGVFVVPGPVNGSGGGGSPGRPGSRTSPSTCKASASAKHKKSRRKAHGCKRRSKPRHPKHRHK